ncbi:MAG: right-handed parallel beta-helix repeat-containing protein [Chloroflexi bacterium]|nr:right-handed parallel beta-helix repeat-containing protein [Chloroflexota bacterium]
MKRLVLLVAMAMIAGAFAMQTTPNARAVATATNLVVTPATPVYDSNNVVAVAADAAPGFSTGSLQSNGVAKTDMYFTPESRFGRAVTVGEVAKISYWTKTGATHAVDPRDWYLTIYTKPYPGDVSTPSWYGDRIGAEPYFSASLADPAATWNQWSTDGPNNKLRFFESTAGAPGATFGAYTDPDWDTLKANNALSGSPYGGHAILFFSIQTGSAWALGFTGQLDGFRIELTDGSVATVNFEAEAQCSAVCYADATSGDDLNPGNSTSPKKTIQAAIDQVSAGGQVRVLPGTYSEKATNRFIGLSGPYQFGLFFPASKPGITLMGVDGADSPIPAAGSTLATINTNATNSFGYSGIFVEAANTTIQGLRIGPNAAGDNKTVEVIGDNFTLRDSNTAIPGGGGSVYLNDWSLAGNVVMSYHILDNIFPDGTSIDIASGAGSSTPLGPTNREILGNSFNLVGGDWNAISFNGSGTGVPWFVNTVGGAVITGNSFAGGSLQYIRARGTYDNSQFDWQSFWDDNSFDKATVALITEIPFDVRTYSYPNFYGTFNNVRRIGATIQGEIQDGAITHAQAGDTVLVKAGTYPEQVVIDRSLKVLGAGAGLSVIRAPATIPVASNPDSAVVKVAGPGVLAEVAGFTVSGPGPSGCGSIAYGIFVRDGADADIHDNTITDIRDQPFSGCQNGVGIQVGRNFLGTAGTATITDNVITGFQKNGITVDGPGSSASIVGNTITGAGPTTTIAQNGVQVSRGATGSVTGNSISALDYTPDTATSTGVLLYQASIVTVTGNQVSTAQSGIYVISTADAVIAGNDISGSGFLSIGLDTSPGASVTGNTVTGGDDGIGVYGGSANATITKNLLTGSLNGIYVDPTNTGVLINRNSIVGNTTGVLVDGTPASDVDATCNWWGSITGPGPVGLGAGDTVSAGATFSPWLLTSNLDGPCPNGPPDLTITSPTPGALFAVNAPVTLTSSYTDVTPLDNYTCSITWDDGSPVGSSTSASGGSGNCNGSHAFTSAGVYTISVTVADGAGASDTETVMVVVYDPSAGFVTGGGTIYSPAGAFRGNLSLEGKATFGFVSKYVKGKTLPVGNTEFQFKTAGLIFSSTAYDWLVVTGNKAQYRGSGAVNGVAGFTFKLTAWDVSGGDKIRMQIWDSAGSLVYDNRFGQSEDIDNANGVQSLLSGSIVIHK